MAVESSEPENESNPIVDALLRLVYAIRGSLLLFIFVIGVIAEVAGIVLQEGAVSGMLGIWGVSAMLYAILGYVVLRAIGYA